MKRNFFLILKDNLVKKAVLVFFGLLGLNTIFLLFKWRSLPPELPLYYSKPKGSEQLGSPIAFLLLPFFTIFFFAVNFFLATLFYKKERLASYILIIIGVVLQILLFIAFIKIVFLVT